MNGHDQSVGDIVLQEWLFFGVLNQYFALFAIDCRREDFIADRDGQRVLSTAKLHLLAQRVLERRAARYGPENEDLVQSILEDLLRPSGTHVESSDVPASAQLEQEPEETQRALIVAVRQLCVRLQREVPTAHQVRYLCGTKNSDHRTLREPVEKLLSTSGVALSQMLKRITPERTPVKDIALLLHPY